ncbi:hypothetical protein [Leptolyngbya phage Lbo-JY46]
MTSVELYKKFLLKLNKNDTNTKIKIPKGEFVLIFNEQKRTWLHNALKDLISSDEITELEDILVIDKELVTSKQTEKKDYFKLPERFFRYQSSYSIAKKDDCVKLLYNFPLKPKNIVALLQNSNTEPDFLFEQTLTELSEGNLVVHKKDFEIEKQFLTYYREPIDIDLEGYIRIDGTPSTNINPDIGKDTLDKILNLCVLEATISYENAESFQMSAQRIKNS